MSLLLLLVLRSSLWPGDGGRKLGLIADWSDDLDFLLAIERRRIVPGDAHLL